MAKEKSYTEAFEELQAIVREISQGEISIDKLAEKIKRAAMLIRICRQKLNETEEDVTAILRELESEEDDGQS